MGSPYPIADILGTPRPVELAGETFMLAPLRVADLGDLGAFAMRDRARGPDPIEVAGSLPGDAPAADRAAAFRAAQDFAVARPPDLGTPGYAASTASAEGLAWFALVALRRHNEGLGAREAAALAGRIVAQRPGDAARLYARAFGTHPGRRLASLLGGDDDGSEPVDWPRLIDRLASERGWTYAEIGEMTLPAFWSALRDGKAPDLEYRPRRGESAAGLRRRIRSLLGLD